MIDRIRHDIQQRLDQLLAEADKLRRALAALDPRERTASKPNTTSSQPAAKAPEQLRNRPPRGPEHGLPGRRTLQPRRRERRRVRPRRRYWPRCRTVGHQPPARSRTRPDTHDRPSARPCQGSRSPARSSRPTVATASHAPAAGSQTLANRRPRRRPQTRRHSHNGPTLHDGPPAVSRPWRLRRRSRLRGVHRPIPLRALAVASSPM